MQIRFCPGYHIARQCNRHCADCAYVILSDVPDHFASLIPVPGDGELLPVLGYGRLESLKTVRAKVDAGKPLPKPAAILSDDKKAQCIKGITEVRA